MMLSLPVSPGFHGCGMTSVPYSPTMCAPSRKGERKPLESWATAPLLKRSCDRMATSTPDLADNLLRPDFGRRAVADHVDGQAIGVDAHIPQTAADELRAQANVVAVFRPQVEVEPGLTV